MIRRMMGSDRYYKPEKTKDPVDGTPRIFVTRVDSWRQEFVAYTPDTMSMDGDEFQISRFPGLILLSHRK
jgi:hypothetical protein